MWIRLLAILLVLCPASMVAQSDTPPAGPPVSPWTSSAGLGVALTSGNSDTRNFNLSFSTTWDPKAVALFKAEALYLYGENEGERQVEKATALTRYERLLSERTFWFGEISWLRDPFKDIDYLIAPMVGAGLHLVKTDARKLTIDGSLGGVFESGEIVGSESSGAVKGGESFEWSISSASKLTQRLSGLWKLDDLDDAFYHFDAGIATTVATRAELKLSYVYDYKNQVASADIEKGDSAFFAALLFKW